MAGTTQVLDLIKKRSQVEGVSRERNEGVNAFIWRKWQVFKLRGSKAFIRLAWRPEEEGQPEMPSWWLSTGWECHWDGGLSKTTVTEQLGLSVFSE